jgi:hypothetical protein
MSISFRSGRKFTEAYEVSGWDWPCASGQSQSAARKSKSMAGNNKAVLQQLDTAVQTAAACAWRSFAFSPANKAKA